MRPALLTSTALALLMSCAAASAQMQQKAPEEKSGASQTQTDEGKAKEKGTQKQGQATQKGSDTAQDKAQPDKGTKGAQTEPKDKSTKGTAQTEPKDKGTKGTAETQPQDKSTKGTAQTEPKDKGTKGTAETQPQDKSQKGTATDSSKAGDPKAADSAKGSAAGGRVQISEQQRTNVHQTILKDSSVNRVTNVTFSINVGTRVPRDFRLAVLPASVITIVPEYRNYRYFVVQDEICIVDPNTYEIVEVVTVSGQTAGRADHRGGSVALVLTEEEKDLILREIDISATGTLGIGVFSEGADVPRGVEVRTFPATVVQRVPKVKEYKFFTAENRLAVVDPAGAKVQLVIEGRR